MKKNSTYWKLWIVEIDHIGASETSENTPVVGLSFS